MHNLPPIIGIKICVVKKKVYNSFMNIKNFLTFINENTTLFVTLCTVCFIAVLFTGLFIGLIIQRIRDDAKLRSVRKDAVKRSRAVLGGQFGEQLAPFLPDFPCNPGDVRFIGKPVDYIAFPGSAEGSPINEVVLIEVKSGTSTLSAREREIKQAVEAGRVRYVTYQLPV